MWPKFFTVNSNRSERLLKICHTRYLHFHEFPRLCTGPIARPDSRTFRAWKMWLKFQYFLGLFSISTNPVGSRLRPGRPLSPVFSQPPVLPPIQVISLQSFSSIRRLWWRWTDIIVTQTSFLLRIFWRSTVETFQGPAPQKFSATAAYGTGSIESTRRLIDVPIAKSPSYTISKIRRDIGWKLVSFPTPVSLSRRNAV